MLRFPHGNNIKAIAFHDPRRMITKAVVESHFIMLEDFIDS
jgi:hypothetical protein